MPLDGSVCLFVVVAGTGREFVLFFLFLPEFETGFVGLMPIGQGADGFLLGTLALPLQLSGGGVLALKRDRALLVLDCVVEAIEKFLIIQQVRLP